MPQIKLDFLFLVQTYAVKGDGSARDAMACVWRAMQVDPACLKEFELFGQAAEFCEMHFANEGAPSWVHRAPEWIARMNAEHA